VFVLFATVFFEKCSDQLVGQHNETIASPKTQLSDFVCTKNSSETLHVEKKLPLGDNHHKGPFCPTKENANGAENCKEK